MALDMEGMNKRLAYGLGKALASHHLAVAIASQSTLLRTLECVRYIETPLALLSGLVLHRSHI